MHWQYHPYVVPLVATAALSITMALFVWRRRPASGATPLALLMLAVAWWSLGYALQLGGTDLPSKLLWGRLSNPGVVIVPTAWLAFVLQYTGREKWLTRRNVALMTIEPVLTLLLVWTDGYHGLFYGYSTLDTSGSLPLLDLTYGVWFWVDLVYSYLLILLGTGLFVQALIHSPRLYRRQVGVLLVAALIPWMAEVWSMSGLSPFYPLDLTTFAFTLSGLAVIWGLFRFRLLDLVPVARAAVIEGMGDAVMVVDARGRMVDLNPAAERIIGRLASEAIGQPAAQVLSGRPRGLDGFAEALMECQHDLGELEKEITLGEGEAQRTYDLRISPLRDRHGRLTARLMVLRDITRGKCAEEVLRQHTAQLQALRQVGLEITAQLDLDCLLHSIVSRAMDLLGGTSGGLYFYHPERDILEWTVSIGPNMAPVGSILQRGEGLSGKVWQTGRALMVDDYRQWEGRAAVYGSCPWTAVVGVPVRWGPARVEGEFLGVLNILADAPRTFSLADAELLGLFASQAAIAIKNAQLYEEAKESAGKLAALCETGKDITSVLELDALLQLIAERSARLTGADKGLILLVDAEAQELTKALGFGFAPGQIEGFTYGEVQDGISGWVLTQAAPTLSNDILADPRNTGVALQKANRERERGRSIAVAPLLIKGDAIGTLTVVNNVGKPVFSQGDLDLVVMLASQAAIAIQNARLYEQVEQRAEELGTAYEELQRTQEALVRTERLAAMSQVAVTVRHEINNPLTAVLGNAEWLLVADQTLSAKGRYVMQEIEKAAIRIRDVVRKLDDIEDRPICYLGETMMIDIHNDRDQQELGADAE